MFQVFTKRLLTSCLFVSLLSVAVVEAQPFQEGKHFHQLTPREFNNKELFQLREEDKGKIQVISFFSYACYWCRKLDPSLDEWAAKQGDKVAFRRVPVVFNRGWRRLAQAFYTAEVLGKEKELDNKLFSAIHDDNINLTNVSLMQQFFEKNGISKKDFNRTFDSFTVTRKVNRADEISLAYNIEATPALAVNGPHKAFSTNASMAGGEKGFLEIIDFLVKEAQKG